MGMAINLVWTSSNILEWTSFLLATVLTLTGRTECRMRGASFVTVKNRSSLWSGLMMVAKPQFPQTMYSAYCKQQSWTAYNKPFLLIPGLGYYLGLARLHTDDGGSQCVLHTQCVAGWYIAGMYGIDMYIVYIYVYYDLKLKK